MSKTMAYGILYFIHYPDIQKKVQDEIDSVTWYNLIMLQDIWRHDIKVNGILQNKIQHKGIQYKGIRYKGIQYNVICWI